MTAKTPGQVAFWRFHYERGNVTVEQVAALWNGIPQAERDAWEAAAQAVLDTQRQQLDALVTEWREQAPKHKSVGDCNTACTYEDCADDLERVLKGGE